MSKPVGGRRGKSRPDQAGKAGRTGAPETGTDRAALRRCLLAVCVIDDIDLLPSDDGALLPGLVAGLPAVEVSLGDCETAIRGADPDSPLARQRLSRWLWAKRAVAERSLDELAERARPVALPVGHSLHSGRGWVRQRVLGGCLEVGLGFVGLDAQAPDDVVVVPHGVLESSGIDAAAWWRGAVEYLENMGALATKRWRRQRTSALRPMGDCDVVTLLASVVFRGALCADAGGMRVVAVPMRHRGWIDLSRIDPAFARAAAAITDEEDRGFARPVLLTVDELVLAGDGAAPAEIVLRDPAVADDAWRRNVLYH